MCMMESARKVADTIDRYFKHVSIITYKGRAVAIGTNKIKTHPKAVMYRFENPHSELDAYHRVPYNLRSKKLVLHNFRFNKQGELRPSAPCKVCMPWCQEVFYRIEHT